MTVGTGSIASESKPRARERSRDVTTTAQRNDRLRELDADRRRAWDEYTERLRDLTGDEYEIAEHDSWTRLQDELDGLERRRASLASQTGDGDPRAD
jgi:hypothetical protein